MLEMYFYHTLQTLKALGLLSQSPMAYATFSSSPLSLFLDNKHDYATWGKISLMAVTKRKRHAKFRVLAMAEDGTKRQRAPPGVDTRIHWESDDEGWIGESTTKVTEEQLKDEVNKGNLLGEKFSELLNASDSHYQFLGVPPNADLEEIKAAYRRLSKEYHPDTTSLPLKTASEKFMRLREIYNTLSNDETRRFYDWTLAQEAASLEAEKMKIKLEDPFMQDYWNHKPVPCAVDRLGGRNMELSDQAMTALTFDVLAIFVSLCCIVYVVFFKEY